MCASWESRLRGCVKGTVWQPGVLESWPGLISAAGLASNLRNCFAEFADLLPALEPSAQIDSACARLQVYWADTQLRGRPGSSLALSAQKGGPRSKWAADPLLPPGLSKDAHVQLSTCLPSPFQVDPVVDEDQAFAAQAMFVFGPFIRTWRRQQSRALQTLVRVLG